MNSEDNTLRAIIILFVLVALISGASGYWLHGYLNDSDVPLPPVEKAPVEYEGCVPIYVDQGWKEVAEDYGQRLRECQQKQTVDEPLEHVPVCTKPSKYAFAVGGYNSTRKFIDIPCENGFTKRYYYNGSEEII